MTLRTTVAPYIDALCLAGYALGALSILGVLPATLPVVDANAKYLYLAALGFISYAYWVVHPRPHPAGYVSHVPARALANPRHAAAVRQQRGPVPPPQHHAPRPPSAPYASQPSDRTFDAFNR